MAIQDILKHLSYNKCDCSVDYRKDLGIVNGVCPKHPRSELTIDGVRMSVYQREVKRRKVDSKGSEIV